MRPKVRKGGRALAKGMAVAVEKREARRPSTGSVFHGLYQMIEMLDADTNSSWKAMWCSSV